MGSELDKDALLKGVCAAFARWADVDLLLVRITACLITIFFAPVAIPAYVLAAAVLKPESLTAERRLPLVTSCIHPARMQP
jgi:phage shock protein PspC (stress-responsive transcriptional regulator)